MKKIMAALAAAMLVSSIAIAAPQNDEPSEVNADAIEYDMNTGIVTAEGNVLLKHGANANSVISADLYNYKTGLTETKNQSVLHYAIRQRYNKIAETLIEHGANVNVEANPTGITGNTPLFYAVVTENADIIEPLLNAGADKNVKNGEGKTAIQYAVEKGKYDIAKKLGA